MKIPTPITMGQDSATNKFFIYDGTGREIASGKGVWAAAELVKYAENYSRLVSALQDALQSLNNARDQVGFNTHRPEEIQALLVELGETKQP